MVSELDERLWWTGVRPELRPRREQKPPRRPKPPRAIKRLRVVPAPPKPLLEPPYYAYEDHPEALTATTYDRRGFFVYRAKDALGKIVYVGYTARHPVDRLTGHRSEHRHRIAGRTSSEPWLHLAATVEWAELPDEAQCRAEEQRQIAHHCPVGNVVYSRTVIALPKRRVKS